MTDSLNMGKKAFTTAVAAATILWSVGISSFVAPMTAHAASAGSLIKGTTLSTLYYYGSDGSRYAFPNEKTYFSWYSDFSSVETISDSALAAIPLAGNVVYRPGSRWIKIQSDPKTYVVTPEGQIRWIESESVASGLAGSDWNTMIDDVADTFFVDYTVGTSLTSATNAFNGAMVSMSGSTYLVSGSSKRLVSSAGMTANRLQSRNVLDGSSATLSGLSAGTELSSAESSLTDAAQLGTAVTGGLSVSLASDTPASATVPGGAASVSFTKVKLMASSGSASVSQMVFHLGGIGSISDLDNSYLYEGSMRLTDARSINSSTRNVTFSGLGISLASGASTYVTVRSDVSTDAVGGDTASFALSSASSVTSTATVSGSFPISGNTMTFSTTDAGTVLVEKTGSITDPTIGETGADIAKFKVTPDGEDATLSQVTINVDQASDHTNYKLKKASTLLATGTVSGDLVTFVLTSSLFIKDGDNANLTVSADIGGQSGDDIGVGIEAATDVVAVGSDYGFNLGVDITSYDATGSQCGSGDDCSFSTIQGGQLTFAFNGPAADDIQVDANEQDLMDFTVTAENYTTLKELDVIVSSSTDDGLGGNDGLVQADGDLNLQNIAIRESDGSVWMGPEDLSGDEDADDTVTFTDDQTMQAGESVDLMITADVDVNTPAGNVYYVAIDMGSVTAEDANGDDVTDITPSSDITGHNFTTVDASLDVNASTPPSDGLFVKGSTGVSVSGFNFEAGNASDVTVTDITYAVTGADDGSIGEADVDVGDYVSSCSLYDSESGSLVDGPESPTDNSGDANLEFQSFSWTVAAGETSKLVLKCNFSNTDLTGGDDDAFAFGIANDEDVVAEDGDGQDVNANVGTDNTDGAVTTITLSDMGSLAVSLDGSTANSTIILGASTGVAMSKFKFTASDEPFVVNHIELDNSGSADDAASVVKISYTNSAGATETKSGYLSAGVVSFDGLDLYVPTESTRTMTVTIDTASVSSTGASAGDTIELDMTDDNFEAIGSASGETVTDYTGDNVIAANEMTLHKTKPTLSLASGSPSGSGVAGDSEVFRFNVAADSRGYVTLNDILFKVVTSESGSAFNACGSLDEDSKFTLYDADDSSTKLDVGGWSFYESNGDACGAGTLAYADLDLTAAAGAEEIGAGETKTYVLKVDTLGASASDDDAIRIEIPDQDEAAAAGLNSLDWEDDTDTTSFYGDLVKNLPVTGGTIQY
ncbi:MAG: hypothetical protein WCO25_03585 [Candidatus Uhrbacteria bacterium]